MLNGSHNDILPNTISTLHIRVLLTLMTEKQRPIARCGEKRACFCFHHNIRKNLGRTATLATKLWQMQLESLGFPEKDTT